jgi:putative aminopeptidase FrvX
MGIPDLLSELLLAPGASGYEDPVHAIVRREAEAIDAEISTDALGTTIATV